MTLESGEGGSETQARNSSSSLKLNGFNALSSDSNTSQKSDSKSDVKTAYLTPDSKASPTDQTYSHGLEWTEDELKHLNYLLHYDLVLSSIKARLPNVSIESFIQKLHSINNEISWTRTEVVHIADSIQTNSSLDEIDLPLRSQQEIYTKRDEIEKLLKSFNSDDDSWTTYELGVLCHQLQFDMTASGLFEELPDKSIEQITKCINHIKVDWTPIEEYYLRIAKYYEHDIEFIEGEIPFKGLRDIKNKLKTIDGFNLKIDQVHLDYLITSGFTRERLRLEMPGIPTREIVMLNGAKPHKISEVEEEIIRTNIQQNKSISYIQSLLPLRKASTITIFIRDSRSFRKRKFKNDIERLLYDSQWYAGDHFGTSSRTSTRSSRRKEPVQLVDDSYLVQSVIAPKSTELTLEEYKLKAAQSKLQQQQKREREEKKRKIRLERRHEIINRPKKVKVAKSWVPSSLYKKLKEEADYFQSVTGDKKLVKDNEKRKRQKTTFFVPPSQERQILKRIMKKKTKKSAKKSSKKSRSKQESDSEDSEDSEESDETSEEEEEEEEEEEHVSPFDPYDITVDTEIPIEGRQLFIDQLYEPNPTLPILSQYEESIDPLIDSRIELSDSTAARIIKENSKRYKDLPSTFPKVVINESQVNPHNKIRVRTLLYPSHSEMFILGLPKAEELNPIIEIQKFFQIHYCLFFSHSGVLKDIIYTDYCLNLDKAIELDDFKGFMKVIDNWNQLMLVLSPNNSSGLFNIDINPEVRLYVKKESTKKESLEVPGLKLDTFYKEFIEQDIEQDKVPKSPVLSPVLAAPRSPILRNLDRSPIVRNVERSPTRIVKSPTKNAPKSPVPNTMSIRNILTSQTHTPEPSPDIEKPIEIPQENLGEIEYIGTFARPKIYKKVFFNILSNKTTISRYCMQQLLIRVYSRVVSTRSSKLRRYKAFTAEVYGELLPSFVSEVLTKTGFKAGQKFYDLGSGVGNTSFQAALEFGAGFSGGCELMEHASRLTALQQNVLDKQLQVLGLKPLNMEFVLSQSFVKNEKVRNRILDCDVLIINNYLFDMKLNFEVGRLLYGIKRGAKIISLRNFITPRYKSTGDATVFDYLSVEKHEMSDFLSVSWTANKVPYYISTVEDIIQSQYL